MAFVQSSVQFCSAFTSVQRSQTAKCSNTKAPTMSLASNSNPAFKALLIAGAFGLGTLTSFPSDSLAALFHFRGERPTDIGLRYDRYLTSCPTTPNCISSMGDVFDSHYVPAWTYNAGPGSKKTIDEAIKDVTKVVEDYPGATIIASKPTKSEVGKGYYIYAEFESKLMGYVDDVEFFFQPDGKTVEYRSASRLGEGDLGANRTRIRNLRVALQDMDKRWASEGYN